MGEEIPAPNCSQCGTNLQWNEDYPVIEWNNGDPDDVFCSKDCVYTWMAINGATWQKPNPQPDVT